MIQALNPYYSTFLIEFITESWTQLNPMSSKIRKKQNNEIWTWNHHVFITWTLVVCTWVAVVWAPGRKIPQVLKWIVGSTNLQQTWRLGKGGWKDEEFLEDSGFQVIGWSHELNLGGGNSNVLFAPILREMIQFDEHILTKGWNHQPGIDWHCFTPSFKLEIQNI